MTSIWPAACSAGRKQGFRPRPAADRSMRAMNKVFADLPVTIFEAMSQAARDNNAINLGQGFPADPGPEDIRRAAADATMDGYNQYPSMMGIPELRQAIATHYGAWHGLTLDPASEVMVTSGGTEALTSAILAVVEPGDEVVVFQPVYDSYLPIIRQAGGIPRLVRLEPPHWRLTEDGARGVASSTKRPRPSFSIIRSIPPRWSIRARTSNCWRCSARSSIPSRSATR